MREGKGRSQAEGEERCVRVCVNAAIKTSTKKAEVGMLTDSQQFSHVSTCVCVCVHACVCVRVCAYVRLF